VHWTFLHSPILSSDFSSRRFIIDILSSGMPGMPPCYRIQHGWFFYGTWYGSGDSLDRRLNRFRSLRGMLGLRTFTYFYMERIRNCILGRNIVSTNLGIDQKQKSWILNMIGRSSLQSLRVPVLVCIQHLGARK